MGFSSIKIEQLRAWLRFICESLTTLRKSVAWRDRKVSAYNLIYDQSGLCFCHITWCCFCTYFLLKNQLQRQQCPFEVQIIQLFQKDVSIVSQPRFCALQFLAYYIVEPDLFRILILRAFCSCIMKISISIETFLQVVHAYWCIIVQLILRPLPISLSS